MIIMCNQDGVTSLILACLLLQYVEHNDAVSLLLTAGAELNIQDNVSICKLRLGMRAYIDCRYVR